ncbi:MAG: hypothetical protein MK132_27170 [Lentisphaerales bacterium]|nr:hypothetical protein [Lentisphaerales bacterium]
MSGDDSGLSNVWNEICVQKQKERSFFYESYIDLIELTVEDVVNDLNRDELTLLWFETESGQEWSCDNPGVKKPPFIDMSSIGKYICGKVLAEANDYQNKEIRDFCE